MCDIDFKKHWSGDCYRCGKLYWHGPDGDDHKCKARDVKIKRIQDSKDESYYDEPPKTITEKELFRMGKSEIIRLFLLYINTRS